MMPKDWYRLRIQVLILERAKSGASAPLFYI